MPGPFDSILRDARRPTAPAKPPRRHEPCWCGSKLKYKKCHMGRDEQAGADFFSFNKRADKASKRGLCLFPTGSGECAKPAISSHTVQRRGGLEAIAENGHVLTTMLGFANLHKASGKPQPRKIGTTEASTFPGFCSLHDTNAFSIIEKKEADTSLQAGFLFYYRALCMELVRKQQALRTVEGLATMDVGMPIRRQYDVQNMVSASTLGLRLGIIELQKHKAEADVMLLNSDWEQISACFVKFDSILPIVTAFAIQHEHDWQGNRLQTLGNASKILEAVSVTVTSYEGKTWAVFAWDRSAQTAAKFVDSFLLIDEAEMAERLVSACFDLAENNYIDPRWWANISQASRTGLSKQILSGIEELHSPAGMQKKAELLSPINVVEVVRRGC